MTDTRKEILSYIDTISMLLLGVLFLVFPLVFTSQTTDPFGLPKQALLATVVLTSLILFGVRMVVASKVALRTTPFDFPVMLFMIVVFVSAMLSINRYDSLTNFVPLLYGALLFFVITNLIKKESSILFAVAALVIGGGLASILGILSYFKIYVLPYAYTQNPLFTPFGSLLDQAIYLALILPLAGYVAYPLVSPYISSGPAGFKWLPQGDKSAQTTRAVAFGTGFLLILAGLALTVYELFVVQKPIILPFETGFRTAFAQISQDTGRVMQSFFLGSGYGQYLTSFTRFKDATYNLNPQLWSFTFFRSSSFVLELLATTGVLGLASFVFILYRFVKEKHLFAPLVLAFIAAFLLPLSFTMQILFFILLGLFAAIRSLQNPKKYADLEYYFVALKKGLFVAAPEGETHHSTQTESRILPGIIFIVLMVIVGALGYMTGRYVVADVTFQRSLVAASQNNGLQTYNLQKAAIQMFPYRDTYYRIFSQTNLALANSLAIQESQNKTPNQQTQQNILTLIQQSINGGRSAVTLSPLTALNWNNLSAVYRALIGFGQNADQFAIATNDQARQLDPNNPQQYISLGGIYYQLRAWEDAQRQFQIAVSLKRDYANAYYNLGHALEEKSDLQNALISYETVKTLVVNDKESVKKITEEIDVLKKKIGEQQKTADQASGSGAAGQAENLPAGRQDQPPIGVDKPSAQLPERDPQEKIPGPPTTPPAGGPTPVKTSVTPSPKP
ncbi:MAG: hypothetical protein HY430_04245 [Candidatus Levybacteria bacterium]|nr:hypothetical protein [Candidatus Levybacteria bacterium]